MKFIIGCHGDQTAPPHTQSVENLQHSLGPNLKQMIHGIILIEEYCHTSILNVIKEYEISYF